MCDGCGHKHHKQGHEHSHVPNAFLDDFLKIEGFDAKKYYSLIDDFEDCENSRDYLLASLDFFGKIWGYNETSKNQVTINAHNCPINRFFPKTR